METGGQSIVSTRALNCFVISLFNENLQSKLCAQ